MIKNKVVLFFIAAILLNLNNISFAVENVGLKNRYPDYDYEFTGKDKCENFNRKIFIFNSKVNKYIIKPINIVWASVMPQYGMDRVQSACTNIEFPIRFVSCLLQKDFKSSKQEAMRFLTNTTLGVGGLYDPAKDKFGIEPHQEDMGQALARTRIKKGPYIVLPIVAQGNVRDIAGQILDYPLNPTSYIIGPVVAMAKAITLMNKTTYLQRIVKTIDTTYADPYQITKKLVCGEKYLKSENLDRKEVLAEKIASQKSIEVNDTSIDSNIPVSLGCCVKADINLDNYSPQCPLIDGMRTVMFEDKNLNDSIWSELSVWNKSFAKQIKTSSISVDSNLPNYKYRYILQKDKTAPLAIIYPSFGEGIMSHHSIVLAKMFYDEGYSVAIQGSQFQWEFIKSMPESYKPGFPKMDTHYSRLVTSKILADLQNRKTCVFSKKVLVGTSFGALTTLFVAAKEEEENLLGISNYISINPPVEIIFALKQVDKYAQDWKNNPTDIKMRAAITASKIIQVAQSMSDKQSNSKTKNMPKNGLKNVSEIKSDKKNGMLPFTEDEAKLILGFVMQQKLSDLIFTMEKTSKSKKSDFYTKINNLSFYDYATKYLHIDEYESAEKLIHDTSLYAISDFLQKSEKYKIYHSIDDYYTNPEQLAWLKRQSGGRAVFFNNGSHLGCLYRREFSDSFKKDIELQRVAQKTKDKVEPETGLAPVGNQTFYTKKQVFGKSSQIVPEQVSSEKLELKLMPKAGI